MNSDFIFKYQEEADDLVETDCQCPPEGACPISNMIAYRFVFEDCGPDSFVPQAADSLDEYKGRPCEVRCRYLSLSFYSDPTEAAEEYAYFSRKFKKFVDRVGEYLAIGSLDAEDGLVLKRASSSHFELFESTTADLAPKFAIHEKLS